MRHGRLMAALTLASVAYTVACPPYEWSAAAWLVPGTLLVATRRLGAGRAALCGLLFSVLVGYGVTGWAYHASLQYFGFNRPLAGAFVVGVWLVYGGIPFALLLAGYAAVAPRLTRGRRAAFGAWAWAVAEMLRAWLVTGMPWELLGHTQFRNLALVQIADLGGVYAVSFVMAFLSVAAAEVADAWRGGGLGIRRAAGTMAAPLALLALALAYGAHARRLVGVESAPPYAVAIVQGNVENAFRWKRAFFERTLARYAQLTSEAARSKPDLIVWPENAVNFYLAQEPMLAAQVGALAALARRGLIVGGPRLASADEARNSAYLLGTTGEIVATYDKQHLVPFAEYTPTALATRPDGPVYRPGHAAALLPAPGLRVGPMICYEVLFPHLVRRLVHLGADVLINLSNDAWLDAGDGVAPRQHFSMAVFRAIETRRYLVRAAATGPSGFIGPYGDVYAPLAAGTAGTAVARVHARSGETPYVRFGDGWLLAAGLLVLGGVATARRGATA